MFQIIYALHVFKDISLLCAQGKTVQSIECTRQSKFSEKIMWAQVVAYSSVVKLWLNFRAWPSEVAPSSPIPFCVRLIKRVFQSQGLNWIDPCIYSLKPGYCNILLSTLEPNNKLFCSLIGCCSYNLTESFGMSYVLPNIVCMKIIPVSSLQLHYWFAIGWLCQDMANHFRKWSQIHQIT